MFRLATNQPAIQNRNTYVKWRDILVMPAQRFGERQGMPITVLVQVRPEIRPPPVGLTYSRLPDTLPYALFGGKQYNTNLHHSDASPLAPE